MSAQHEPGFECPDCGTKLFSSRKCMQCGWRASDARDDSRPTYDAWQCQRCHSRSSGTITGEDGLRLCPPCHFETRIRPFASRAEDLCRECSGQAPHAIRAHIDQFKAAWGEVEAHLVATR